MSTKILHISDLHFGPPFVPAVAEAVLKTIPSLDLDAVVVSGDLTQRATRQQFEQARAFFDRLPDLPLLVIPGNHDVALWRIFERLFKPHALYCEIIHPDLNPVIEVGNVVLAGLDSTAPRRSISNGRLDLDQLQRCAETFAEVPDDKTRIVVAHHQFAPGHDRVFDIAMPGARRAIDWFVEQKVEMILGGHLHRSYIGNSLDFFPGHHRDRGVIIVQCGTTTSSRGTGRERDENTFNLIEAGSRALTVTHYLYFEEAGEFAAAEQTHVSPSGAKIESWRSCCLSTMSKQLQTKRNRRKVLVLGTTAILLAVLAWYVHSYISLEKLVVQEDRFRATIALHPWRSFAVGFAVYFGLSLIPGTGGKAIVYGWLFGFWQAMIIVMVALSATAMVIFSLSRYLFRERVERRYTNFLTLMNRHIEREGALYLLTLRMAHAPFSIINPVSGASRVRSWTFFWTTVVGLLPGTVVWAYVGMRLPSLRDLLDSGPTSLIDPPLIVALIASAALPLLFRWLVGHFGIPARKRPDQTAITQEIQRAKP